LRTNIIPSVFLGFNLKNIKMKKYILFILLLVVLMMSCSTTQNSVTNNNTPTVSTPQNQVHKPVKNSNKYQKNKGGDQLMTAPAAIERVNERVEKTGSVRDTL
jgi:uncharacterized lipoprotein YajG